MNNETIFEVTKYLESSGNIGKSSKLSQALRSKEVKVEKFKNVSEVLSSKIIKRPEVSFLIDKNIYKEGEHSNRFADIHEKLKSIIIEKPKILYSFTTQTISPRLADAAKQLDFHLKRKVLRRLIKSKT